MMPKFQLSNRERNIVVILVFILLGYAVYAAIYIPWIERGVYISQRLSSAEKKLEMILKTIKISEELEAQYQSVLNDYQQTTSDEEVMSSILSEIEEVSSLMNIRISDMKPKKVKNIDIYNNFAVSMSVSGTLLDIFHFIHTLEDSPHRLNVDELQLSKKSSRNAALKCKIVFSRLLYP